MGTLGWTIGVLGILGVYVLFSYNRLIRMRNQVKEAWSDIEIQLKRRHNLIPNVVETVKGYARHEQTTFDSVTKARADAVSAKSTRDHAAAENTLSATLRTLFAVSENYPDLKANANFLELQRELSDTENKIQAARRFYNGTVRDYNTAIQSVPTNILAHLFTFTEEEFFELDEQEARTTPKVTF